MSDRRMPTDIQRALRNAGLSRRGFLRVGGGGLAGAAFLGVSGCGVFGSEEEGSTDSEAPETMNRNLGAEIDDLDSATATDEISFEVLYNTMEGLYRLDPSEEPQPAQAEGVEVSEDELVYTFRLRDGITWSNGDLVTSRHFKFAWLRAMDPKVASQYSFILAEFVKGGAEYNAGKGSRDQVAIETPDDRTLQVTLVGPTPFFLGLTAFTTYLPQNEEFVGQQAADYAKGAANLLFNGPYKMTRYSPASGGTLEKNDRYWDKTNVDIERINMRIVKDTNTALTLYQSGEIDLTGLTGEQVPRFEDSPELFRTVNFTHFFGQMNQGNPAMANLNIRKALMTGFDRKLLTDRVLNDGSEPAYAFVPPGMEGPEGQTFREANGDLVEPDPAAARGLWEQGVRELGKAPKIVMLFSDSSTARDIATFIQAEYQKHLGIRADIDITTFENALDRVNNRDYQISFASGWGADYNDPMTFMQYFTSGSGFNRAGWSNDRYDKLVGGARKEPNNAKRMAMMLEAEKILFEEAVLVPEYFEAVVGLKKPYLKNFVSHPYGPEPDWKYARLDKQ
ncbi:peptide ABC transporter substrate-binding protein [Tenggerimyces flavus]|uniref:Peptide ABC transporter substrate-binding protein n=1 Tax=Tenggerimyces flavus TaxID=1708749 RepID=A0ABV7YLM0_9ACTN|nr:peptide ABC transporter substrate-binding protein [Tenggerimyces flavus]MBM7790224.1 oligopeptide transport system substrate-binding protein [Tenggerimyces flavus]